MLFKVIFRGSRVFRYANYSSITLKVINVTSVKDFRLIAGCLVVYKYVSKILIIRLQIVDENLLMRLSLVLFPEGYFLTISCLVLS